MQDLAEGIRSATQEEIEQHDLHFSAPLIEFRRVRYRIPDTDLIAERRLHILLLKDAIAELRGSGVEEIRVFNMFSGEESK